MAVFFRVDKSIVEAVEQDGTSPDNILRYIPYYQVLRMEDEALGIIDFVLKRIFEENKPYSLLTYEGEVLAYPDGEAYIPNLLELDFDDGSSVVLADPSVYKTPEEVSVASGIAKEVSDKLFKRNFKFRKIIKELSYYFDKSDLGYKKVIRETAWARFERLSRLFDEAMHEKQYILLLQ